MGNLSHEDISSPKVLKRDVYKNDLISLTRPSYKQSLPFLSLPKVKDKSVFLYLLSAKWPHTGKLSVRHFLQIERKFSQFLFWY